MSRRFLPLAFVVLALVSSACANKTKSTEPAAGPTKIPSVKIGECVTNQGTQAAAVPKGVDWKTQLKQPGVLNVGSDNAYPPFEEIPAGKKEPVGFDVDLYKEVAKRMGLTAKSTTTDFDGLFTQSLPTGQFDIGVSAITIKEGRKKTVDFTVPYFRADLSLAINVQKTPSIKTIDDLAGLVLGVQAGTTGEDCAKALVAKGKGKEVKSYRDAQQAFQDLVAGRVAAVVNDQPASQGFIEKQPDILKVVQILETQEEYGFAVGRAKPDLREEINKNLTAMMNDGTYATIYKTWFKTAPPFKVPVG
jgi:polar amino acid transport system substrate-binding protein